MRRRLALTTCALLVAMVVPLAAAGAQEPTGPAASAEATGPELRIEAPDLGQFPEVRMTVSVAGAPGSALPPEAFTVREDGEQRDARVTYADTADLQVVLLIDTTGSMGGPPMAAAKSAATTFVGDLPEDASLAVIGYDAEARVLTDFAASREQHVAAIEAMVADGTTAMYDAVTTAVGVFGDDPDTHRVIVLLTDGEDNESTATVDDAVAALTEANVTLHSVEYLTAYTEGAGIRSMAIATGGAIRRADDAGALSAVYQQLAADLVSRYQVAYTSEGSGRVELDVAVTAGEVQAGGRRTVTLPEAAATPTTDATDTAAPPLVSAPAGPPVTPPTQASLVARVGLAGGAALWFIALALLAFVFVRPRERRTQLAGLVGRAKPRRKSLGEFADRASLVAERSLERHGRRGGLNAALEQAGIDLRPGEFVVLVVSAAVTAGIVGRLLHGWLLGALLVVVTAIASRLVLSILTDRRQRRFADQLPQTLQLLSGSLRAGYSLMQAVNSVARESEAPTAEEFSRLVVETRLGRDMHEALQALSDRMQSDDFAWVMQAIEIHREVGGDLAEVLDNVGTTIRERNQIRRQVKALSAEGKLSAYVLIALPFGVGGLVGLSNPSYLAELPNGGLLGWGMIGLGVILMVAGIIWIRNLVKFRF